MRRTRCPYCGDWLVSVYYNKSKRIEGGFMLCVSCEKFYKVELKEVQIIPLMRNPR